MFTNLRSTRGAAVVETRTWMWRPSSTTLITRFFTNDFHIFNTWTQFPFIVIISTLSTWFPVGAPVPDIQRAPVLLSSTLLAQYGGRAHEVLWQGNHYKVMVALMANTTQILFKITLVGSLKIKRRRKRGWLHFSERTLPTSELKKHIHRPNFILWPFSNAGTTFISVGSSSVRFWTYW